MSLQNKVKYSAYIVLIFVGTEHWLVASLTHHSYPPTPRKLISDCPKARSVMACSVCPLSCADFNASHTEQSAY